MTENDRQPTLDEQAGMAWWVSIGYRWLDFRQGGDRAVRILSMGGAILAAAFHF